MNLLPDNAFFNRFRNYLKGCSDRISITPSQITYESGVLQDIPEELLANLTGACGKWQAIAVAICFSIFFLYSFNNTLSLYLAPSFMEISCNGSNYTKVTKCSSNYTHCTRIYYKENFGKTVFESYQLQCKENIEAIQLSYRIGVMFGSVFTGVLADLYGRRLVLLSCAAIQIISGILQMFYDYAQFLMFRAFIGISFSAFGVLPLVIITEIVGNAFRTLCLGLLFVSLGLNLIIFPLTVNVLNDHFQILMVLHLSSFIFLIFIGFLHDSPNWLFLMKTSKDAEEVIMKVAKYNGYYVPSEFMITALKVTKRQYLQHTMLKMFSCLTTTMYFVNLILLWFNSTLCCNFFLLSLLSSARDLNILITIGTTNMVCIIITILLLYLFPHKWLLPFFTHCSCILAAGVLLCTKFSCQKNMIYYKVATISAFVITIVIISNLSPRMFSTDMRAQCLGLCFAAGEMGALIASFLYSIESDYLEIYFISYGILVQIISRKLWKLHRREIPDLYADVIKFTSAYKPVRYTGVKGDLASYNEEEIRMVSLADSSLPSTSTSYKTKPLYKNKNKEMK